MDQTTFDAMLAGVGHKTAHFGGVTTAIAWLMSSEGGVVIGILIGLTGLLVQWHYSRKRDRREQDRDKREREEHEARMRELLGE